MMYYVVYVVLYLQEAIECWMASVVIARREILKGGGSVVGES